MEIISIGQKIKRARIYGGYTLKDICGDKISVSKLSCIENDKIKPEPWIMEFIAEKLDMDYDYLNKDVDKQILEHLDEISKRSDKDEIVKGRKEILKACMEFGLSDIAYLVMHELFSGYVEDKKFNQCRSLIKEYYDLSVKYKKDKYIYYEDVGDYILAVKEYMQAYNYYSHALKSLRDEKNDPKKEMDLLCKILECNIRENNTLDNDIINELLSIRSKSADEELSLKTYSILGLYYKVVGEVEKYNQIISYINKNDLINKEKCLLDIAYNLRDLERYKDALEILDIIASEVNTVSIETIILKTEVLYLDEQYKDALEYADKVLNESILSNDEDEIEMIYYLKAKIYIILGNLQKAEIYFNISLDFIKRLNNKEGIITRYMEMGELYYKIGDFKEGSKCFDAALKTKNKYNIV